MTESTERRALALFERLLELPEPDRAGVLERECTDAPEVRRLVEELLQADQKERTLLDDSTPPWHELVEEPSTIPDRIGPYRVLGEAGRGGMSTVYRAERDVGGSPQEVALKLVRRGIDTDEVIRRFAQEARVLASLEHPNIARLYDAGASDDGRPYLVMEFVEGEPLTAFCDRHRLTVAERLELFQTVCEAVQYAQQRLVVHRDIKPSNVLVTEGGQVRLLDFGIAKLLSDQPDVRLPLTRTGVRVLTPEYAAPEQLRGETISTATDVFALGLVLYELLTGVRARAAANATPATPPGPFDAVAPSTLVRRGAHGEEIVQAAAARGTTAPRLRRRLRGDLDRITLKALEPDPSRRYPSAQQLRDDIERHLRGLPVEARPSTLGYRLQKFTRRHRASVAAGVVATTALIGFSVFHTARITEERDLAQGEAAKARATTVFLQRLLGDAYPTSSLGDSFSLDELLERAEARIDSLDAQPEIQAELLRTIGDVYRERARFDDALSLLERAVAIHTQADDPVSREAGQAFSALGHLHHQMGNFQAAVETHRASLDIFSTLHASDDTLVLHALNNVAAAAAELGDHEEALRLYETILARHERLFADTSQLVHVTRNNLGNLRNDMGDHAGAEKELRETLRLRLEALPTDHPSIALTLNNLASALKELGRMEEAEDIHRQALDIFRRVYGPEHPWVGLSSYNLAGVLENMERYDEAETLFRTTLDIDRKTLGERHLEVGVDLRGLGVLLEKKGDCDEAVDVLREADEIFDENDLPLTHRRRMTARASLGACLSDLDHHTEAAELLRAGLRAAERAPAEADSVALRETLEALITTYRAWGRPGQADSLEALRRR